MAQRIDELKTNFGKIKKKNQFVKVSTQNAIEIIMIISNKTKIKKQ